MNKVKLFLILISLFFISNIVSAQVGFLDPTFGTNGLVSSVNIGYSHATTVQPDGKVIVVGEFSAFAIERFNEDGSVDNSFGVNGRVLIQFEGESDAATGVVIDENNNILVSGYHVKNSITNIEIVIVRLKPNGLIDSTYGKDGIASLRIDKLNHARAMVKQADEKIIVVGEVGENEYDNEQIFIARFGPNGFIDKSFGDNGYVVKKFDKAVSCVSVALQDDGKIVTGGTYNFYTWQPAYMVMRFNPDGSMDNGFGDMGKANYTFGLGEGAVDWDNALYAVSIQPDGKIIAAGKQGDYSDFSFDMGIVRFNADGSLDNSYGENGSIKLSYPDHYTSINTLQMQPDGKLIAGATAQNGIIGADPMLLIRFLDNGTLDPAFANNGMQVTTNNQYSILCKASCLQQDGKIIIAGYSNGTFLAARFNGDNVLATHFKNVQAIQDKESITISWQTLNECGTKNYSIERSSNATDFVSIATVPAKGGQENSYSYTDHHPLVGTSYYRIKENAVNGTSTFSNTLKVIFESNTISLYPNPAKNTVTIKGLNKNATATIRITDMHGRELLNQKINNSSAITLPIRALAQGSYFVLIEQNGKVEKLRLVKE